MLTALIDEYKKRGTVYKTADLQVLGFGPKDIKEYQKALVTDSLIDEGLQYQEIELEQETIEVIPEIYLNKGRSPEILANGCVMLAWDGEED